MPISIKMDYVHVKHLPHDLTYQKRVSSLNAQSLTVTSKHFREIDKTSLPRKKFTHYDDPDNSSTTFIFSAFSQDVQYQPMYTFACASVAFVYCFLQPTAVGHKLNGYIRYSYARTIHSMFKQYPRYQWQASVESYDLYDFIRSCFFYQHIYCFCAGYPYIYDEKDDYAGVEDIYDDLLAAAKHHLSPVSLYPSKVNVPAGFFNFTHNALFCYGNRDFVLDNWSDLDVQSDSAAGASQESDLENK